MFGRKNRRASSMPFHTPYSGGGYVQNQTMNNSYDIRQQPNMNYYQPLQPQPQWNGMPYSNPGYPPYNIQAGMASMQPYPNPQPYYQPQQNSYFPNQMPKQTYGESVFQNPLQPMEDEYLQANQYGNQMQYANPYPKQSFIAKPPSGMQSVMNSFKGQDGSLDLNKMMNTAGQMMNAVNQVSSMVKGLGGIFKA